MHLEAKQFPWSIMSYRWLGATKLKPKETVLLEKQMEFLSNLQLDYPDSLGSAPNHHVCGIIALGFELAKKNHDQPIDWESNQRVYEFVEIVEQHFTSRRVNWYAEQMGCSPRTLSRICQLAIGKSAKAALTARTGIATGDFPRRYHQRSGGTTSLWRNH